MLSNKKKETQIKNLTPVSVNRPLNNWAKDEKRSATLLPVLPSYRRKTLAAFHVRFGLSTFPSLFVEVIACHWQQPWQTRSKFCNTPRSEQKKNIATSLPRNFRATPELGSPDWLPRFCVKISLVTVSACVSVKVTVQGTSQLHFCSSFYTARQISLNSVTLSCFHDRCVVAVYLRWMVYFFLNARK